MWVARTRLFVPTGGDRPLVPDLAIIITDGVPNREQDSYYQEVFELRVNKCALQIDLCNDLKLHSVKHKSNLKERESR